MQCDVEVRFNVTAEYLKSSPRLESESALVTEAEYENLAEILKDNIAFYQAYKGR